MTCSRRLALGIALGFAWIIPALADPYVTAKMLDITVLVPPPPRTGSDTDKADMAAVIAAQAHASDARKAQALADSEETIFAVYGALLGAKFTAANAPRTARFYERIGESEDDTLDAAKPYFGRVRPWLADPDVKAIAKPTKSGSYPSGHTARVAIYAIMMARMLPERKDALWARAADYAESRVVGGMHYPTDILAGWRAGTAIATLMLQDPAFAADFEAARTELRAALEL